MRRVRVELGTGESEYLDAVIGPASPSRGLRHAPGAQPAAGARRPRASRGWLVAPAIPLVHRDPDLFPAPDDFDPDRFLSADPPVAGWIPFGGGQRRCVGSRLALLELLELQTVVSAVLGRFELAAAEAAPERQRVRGVTLTPGKGARVVVGRRLG